MAGGAQPGWNHNTHYHRELLDALPRDASDVLDVGCGAGALARELADRGLRVTAMDVDQPTLERARAHGGDGIAYVLADFMSHDFGAARFDAVLSVAALHHLDAEAALVRMRDLLRPGGLLGIVGLARSRRAQDLVLDIAAVVPNRWLMARRNYAEVTAPTMWPPPLSYAQIRDLAGGVLPGAQFRRRLFWRYTLTWVKPVS